jgi:outer membrane receptor for ferric coprogen and ferric-rhodotorulic acid
VVDNELPAMPFRTLNVWGVYAFGSDLSWEAGTGVYLTSSAWADTDNSFRVPGIEAWELMLSHSFFGNRAQLQVNVKNLTDRRNYASNGWGWINPSDPRTAYATIRYGF